MHPRQISVSTKQKGQKNKNTVTFLQIYVHRYMYAPPQSGGALGKENFAYVGAALDCLL